MTQLGLFDNDGYTHFHARTGHRMKVIRENELVATCYSEVPQVYKLVGKIRVSHTQICLKRNLIKI
ncbi:hypothetical protein C8N40_11192 [Pontibacter mucosus]|uniref:Uncharacterized protein n=1 Tax=Pontibacter mucosus TaxID=1649266 RepID=A0A2T5YD03_9BACT|nr:hypothetical protein [Pontibacter mucosus]PTX14427.1 hypothetical protein C8N40_11192 [Pontibacter mucosus]